MEEIVAFVKLGFITKHFVFDDASSFKDLLDPSGKNSRPAKLASSMERSIS